MLRRVRIGTYKDEKNPDSHWNGKRFKVLNGTYYNIETSNDLVRLLEEIRINRWPIQLHYGNIGTGEDWGEVNDVTGTLARSTGPIKVPIILENSFSSGGSAILDHCIVMIVYQSENGAILHRHPNYHKRRKTA